MRLALAALLERVAASLRAAAAREPVRRPAQVVRPARPHPRHPHGFWLCTHSTFDQFLVGCAYHADASDGGSVRVRPYTGSSWAPFWQADEGRFCYPARDIDFVYLGPTLPEGQRIDTRTMADRYPNMRAA
jgi:hypothetical protein